MNNRIFVIADIHGELNKLNTLLNNLNIVESDRFIFLGDYVDRGPKSYEVIERLLSLNTTNRCDFILGNHDYEFFKDSFTNENDDSISNNERYRLWDHGVKETLASYINNNKSPEIHKSFYEMLKLYLIETINNKKYIFVHAGFNRNISIKSQDEYIEHMIYDRTLLIDAMLCHVKDFKQTGEFTNKDNFDYICIGHTPVKYWGYTKPTLFKNVWALDTGVGKYEDSELYALEILTNKLYK